jgi:hypothetical protein
MSRDRRTAARKRHDICTDVANAIIQLLSAETKAHDLTAYEQLGILRTCSCGYESYIATTPIREVPQ